MKKDSYNIAIAGATGAVGQEMMEILLERNFPVKELRLLASERSAGKELSFNGSNITIQKLDENSFENIDIALVFSWWLKKQRVRSHRNSSRRYRCG